MKETRVTFTTSFGFAGNKTITQFTQLINFKRIINGDVCGRTISSLPYVKDSTNSPTNLNLNKTCEKCYAKNEHQIDEHSINGERHKSDTHNISNKNDRIRNSNNYYNKTNDTAEVTSTEIEIDSNEFRYDSHLRKNRGHTNRKIVKNSQCFIQQSIRFYAASGFLIALCYLAIPAAASIDSFHPM